MAARGCYIIVSLVVAILVAYAASDALRASDSARGAMIDIFSILAGVLVAVISIVGDPSMLLPGNWRVGAEHAQEMQRKISNFSHLFFSYIVSLALTVIANAIVDNKIIGFNFVFYALTFFSTFSFMLSVPLPYSLMAIQSERMNEEVNSRKRRATPDPADDSGSQRH
ncbi:MULTISPECIES: hypothetical protein [Sinorhizobium]|uniref:hypothetical protein n=1 Tax=Sinorhizobium TaxID=28105 RepID=UPI000AF7658C|nr:MULTISPECIES: hypothetical protein [Sinorhizobium]WOS67200.1 hypothetical protein SFGR64A_30990 [Sinorhizobium fredii GR64]